MTAARASRGVTGFATLWVVFVAAAATAPALFGNRSLGPESLLDSDLLYAPSALAPRPPIGDPSRICYDVPRDFAAADGFGHGRIDLWNPRVGFGLPLWAEGGAPFFPPKIPFYFAPSRRTYDLAAALRLVIAGLGAFLLARRRGLAPVPAIAAGSLFELSGAIISTLPFGSGAPPCLLPWVLLGAEVIAQRRTLASAAATGLALGAAASSGHPMLVVVVFAGFGAAIGGHALAAWRRPRAVLAIGALATLAVALGLAVAAPVFLPLLEALHVGRLYKNTWTYEIQLSASSAIIRGGLPIALFAPATLNGLRAALPIAFPYTLVGPTVGLFALVLAVAGLLQRGIDTALLAVGLVGVGLTLAPPVLGFVRHLPLLHQVYPMYAWSLVALPLTQAAGQGVATLSMRSRVWTLLAALAVVLAGASSLLFVQDLPGTLWAFPVRKVLLASLRDWAGCLRLALPLALLPLVVVALVVGTRTRLGDRCAIAATALSILELLVSVAPTAWFSDSAVLGSSPAPALRFLQHELRGDQYRMLGWPRRLGVGRPATPSLFGLADVRGVAAVPVERYVRYLEAISPNSSWYVWQSPDDVLRHPLLDLAGTRYLVRPRHGRSEPEPFLESDAAVRLAYRDDHVAIYENDAALPRARIVHIAVAVRDPEEAFQRLVDAAGASAHAAAAGLVDRIFTEPSADGYTPPPETPAAAPASSESVQMIPSNDPDQVELQASLVLPGWVVLADTFYPGWTATIDGVATPIHPVDLLFRGVFVPPGTHRIMFRYEPPAFRLGVALAVVGLAVSGLLLVRGARATTG